MEEIIAFIKPIKLTERLDFSVRVFMNWVILYTFIGLILGITFSLSPDITKAAKTGGIAFVVDITFRFSSAMCIIASIGLGVDSLRGVNEERAGWYWLLYPLTSYVMVSYLFFYTFFYVVLVFLSLSGGGIEMPKYNFPRGFY